MPDYKCERCGHSTDLKANLRIHLQRKKMCQDILECNKTQQQLLEELNVTVRYKKKPGEDRTYNCPSCDKTFKNPQSVYHHKQACSKPTAISAHDIDQKLSDLMSAVNTLITKGTVTQNITITNNNNINICAFGKENLDHVTHEFLTSCLLNRVNDGYTDLFKLIHFNDDVPENQNIKLKNQKQLLCYYMDDGRWNVINAYSLLDKIIDKNTRIFTKHLLSNKNTSSFPDERFDHILSNVIKIQDKKGQDFYGVRRDLFSVIVGHPQRMSSECPATPSECPANAPTA